jgi:hypothetical protein
LLVHVDDARVPVENMMHPIALGRKNWLFIGSQQAGERAAILMRLIESAKLNGHDAWAYLKDVLTKLPTWPNSRLAELLLHAGWRLPLPDRLRTVNMGCPPAYGSQNRQRTRVHLPGIHDLGTEALYQTHPDRTWQSDTKRLHRELQRNLSVLMSG